jgi:antitoxin (DNA-binding transcriptional repressor) of toxin-antitoxin stability system
MDFDDSHELVIAPRHYERMAEPAAPPPRRIELPLSEVRARLPQIVRLTPVSRQVTVIMDRGRPVAAIVPIDSAPGVDSTRPMATRAENAAAGWERRIEQVREAVRRQHAMRTVELEHALTEVWAALDRLRPPGLDRTVDELRIAHRDVVNAPPPAGSPLVRGS